MTSDGHAEAMQVIEPDVLNGSNFSIGQDGRSTDQGFSGLLELPQDRQGALLYGRLIGTSWVRVPGNLPP